MIHTSATLVPVFAHLCKEKLPGVDVFNIADDSLIKDVIRSAPKNPPLTPPKRGTKSRTAITSPTFTRRGELTMGKLGTVRLAAAIFSPWMNISGSILANYWRRKPVP